MVRMEIFKNFLDPSIELGLSMANLLRTFTPLETSFRNISSSEAFFAPNQCDI